MKRTLFAALVLSLAAGIAAAQVPQCCLSPGGEYIKAEAFYGPTYCPAGFQALADPCPVAVPAAPAADFEPKPVDVPGWVLTIVGFFSQNKTLPIPFAALLGAILIPLVGIVRSLLATFGAKLGPRGVFIVTAVLAFLGAFATAAGDGVIAGDEWGAVVSALGGMLAAFFGYKLIFSDSAKAKYRIP